MSRMVTAHRGLWSEQIEHSAPHSVGLAGDGDEISAIEEVEREFSVVLDKSEAERWHTAGDLYTSLLRALPESRNEEDCWPRFTNALARETGITPSSISAASPLIDQRGVGNIHWLLIGAAVAVALALLTLS